MVYRERKTGGGMLPVVWLIALAFDMGKTVVLLYPQTQSLWLHLYAGYFGAGIMIAKCKIELDKRCSRYMQIVLALSVNICSMFVYFYKVFLALEYRGNYNNRTMPYCQLPTFLQRTITSVIPLTLSQKQILYYYQNNKVV